MSNLERRALCCVLSIVPVACASSSAGEGAVFGGEGAQVEARQTPLDQAPEEADTGPCAKAAPASADKLIDDFEDDDNQVFKAFQREGWWYVAVDKTQGTIFPGVGEFTPSPLPEGEASVENRYALHGKAEGYTDWGVVWGMTTQWVDKGLKCPFNASKFVGMTFRAKGSGALTVKIGNPLTVPPEYGGKCKEKCWDTHQAHIPLSEQWQPFVVRWEKLQQGGWGADARFDPERLLQINFSVDGKDLPVEFWLDDLRFLSEGDRVESVPAPPTPGAEAPPATTPPATTPAPSATTAPNPKAAAPSPKPNQPNPPQAPTK